MRKIIFYSFIAALLFSESVYASEIVIASKYVKKMGFSPADKQWNNATTFTVPLMKQVLVAPHGGSVSQINVASVHTDKEIFIKLSWLDNTKDTKFSQGEKFSDGCAVEFPMRNDVMPSPIMGEKQNPVNIWLWRAIAQEKDRIGFPSAYSDFYRPGSIDTIVKYEPPNAENLIAEGYSTITPLEAQDIEAVGIWQKGAWQVVIKRGFNSKSGVALGKDINIPIAFAVWDGANQERDGQKAVSVWHILKIGDAVELPKPKDDIAKGERVFLRYGCITCHGKEGKYPIANLNAQGGKVPSLTYVAEGFTINELKDRIRKGKVSDKEDPQGPHPPLAMNAWQVVMDEEELDALAKYLFNLLPKDAETWTQ